VHLHVPAACALYDAPEDGCILHQKHVEQGKCNKITLNNLHQGGLNKPLYIVYFHIIHALKALIHIDPALILLDVCFCVEWTILVFLDAACYPDVSFHSPTDGRDAFSSCCATSLSVTTCEMKYDVNFVASA